jgi:exopolysaccharide production protein ExoZ
LLSVTPRLRMLTLALLFAPALVVPAEVSSGSPLLGILLNPLMLEFLVGVVLARLYIGAVSISRTMSAGLIAMAVGLLLFELNNNVTSSLQRLLIWGLPAVLLAGGVVLARRAGSTAAPGLAARIGAWIGDISYSLYLSHFFAISMFSKVYFHYLINFKLPALLVGAALFGFCLLVGYACYLCIERPARILLNAWLDDTQARPHAARQVRS